MLVDIIVLALFIISAAIGYKKGFVKIAAKIVGFILAIILAYLFSDNLAHYIYTDLGMGASMKNDLQQNVLKYFNDKGGEKNIPVKGIETPKFITKLIDSSGMNPTKNPSGAAEKITIFLFNGLSFAIIVILVTTAVWIASIFLDGIFSLPVLNSFNELGGAIASILLTLIKVWIVLGIIGFMAPLEFMTKINSIILNSSITSSLYNNNVLVNLIINKVL